MSTIRKDEFIRHVRYARWIAMREIFEEGDK